jgi:histone deacetylase complex regulatory component SIN3
VQHCLYETPASIECFLQSCLSFLTFSAIFALTIDPRLIFESYQIETPVKAMYIQLRDKDAKTAAEAKEEEWESYIHNYQLEVPTEGVDMQRALLKMEERWPILRRHIRELDDPNVFIKERSSFIIHSNTYKFTVKQDYYDEIQTANLKVKSDTIIKKLRKLASRKYQKAVEEQLRTMAVDDAEKKEESKEESGASADVEMADADESMKIEAAGIGHEESVAGADPPAGLTTEQGDGADAEPSKVVSGA